MNFECFTNIFNNQVLAYSDMHLGVASERTLQLKLSKIWIQFRIEWADDVEVSIFTFI